MNKTVFRVLLTIAMVMLVTGLAFAAGAAEAEVSPDEWPNRPVVAVVPYSAGGSTDISVRLMADVLTEHLGVPVEVQNRSGAGGSVGASWVYEQPADGHTLLWGSGTGSFMTIAPRDPDLGVPYTRQDFTPLVSISNTPRLLAIRTGAPFETAEDMLEWGRNNPGQLTFGQVSGSGAHLMGEYFMSSADIEAVAVPYDGGADIMAALAGGHVDFTIQQPAELLPQKEAGNIKLVASLTLDRHPEFPELPTLREMGFDDVVMGIWYTAFVRSDTPDYRKQILKDAIIAAAEEPRFVEGMKRVGETPAAIPGSDLVSVIEDYERIFAMLMEELGL